MQVISCVSFTSVLWSGAISIFYKTDAHSPIIITFQVFVEWKSYLFRQNHSELHGSGAGVVKKNWNSRSALHLLGSHSALL